MHEISHFVNLLKLIGRLLNIFHSDVDYRTIESNKMISLSMLHAIVASCITNTCPRCTNIGVPTIFKL